MHNSSVNYTTYTYNAEGKRTQKIVNGQVHTFTWVGDKIVKETYASVVKEFFYDAQGRPHHFTYNGTVYFYVLNIFGDVCVILDASGNICGSYLYDAYGNTVSSSGSAVGLNPVRYRGYFYDGESGLYYCGSRYYDPELGRFISPDAFVSTGQGFTGNNMFAYCNNNPVMFADPTGDLPVSSMEYGAVAMLRGESGYAPYIPEDKRKYYEAVKTYNTNTIQMYEDEIGTDPSKLNVTFYPNSGLIHVENSYPIKGKYEKLAVINTIMKSSYYDPGVYGNSIETMLMEWSGHNFVYHTSTNSKLMYYIFQRIGFETPIESTRSVDFRKSLAPSSRRNYEWVTLWGLLQW